jgi:hypothetical protein
MEEGVRAVAGENNQSRLYQQFARSPEETISIGNMVTKTRRYAESSAHATKIRAP